MNCFSWEVDGHQVLFRLGQDGKYRPFDSPLKALVWAVEGGYRASISNGRIIRLSCRPTSQPQGALETCARFFRKLAA